MPNPAPQSQPVTDPAVPPMRDPPGAPYRDPVEPPASDPQPQPMRDPVTPEPYRDPPQPPAKDEVSADETNRTGDGEWQPGGDPRHKARDRS